SDSPPAGAGVLRQVVVDGVGSLPIVIARKHGRHIVWFLACWRIPGAVTWRTGPLRITVINPNVSAELTYSIAAAAQSVSGSGVTVVGVNPTVGVPSVESHAEETFAA